MLKVIEHFAGIGSTTQALKNIGIEHEVIMITEIDRFVIQSYKALHGDVETHDITKLEECPQADLWTISTPCQSISVAGKLAGITKGSGTKSSLLWEVERLLIKAQQNNTLPKCLLLENVKNLIGKNFKGEYDVWVAFLDSLDYTTYTKVLNAKDYGVPHCLNSKVDGKQPSVQNRIYDEDGISTAVTTTFRPNVAQKEDLLMFNYYNDSEITDIAPTQTANCGSSGSSAAVLQVRTATKLGYEPATDGDSVNLAFPRSNCRRGRVGKQICKTLDTGCNHGVVENCTIRKLTPKECWRLMGWKDEDIQKVIDCGMSNSQMYKQAGNSICTCVLDAIFTNLFIKGDK